MFLFYVLSFFKKEDTIQGGTLFKGRHYLRKYGIYYKNGKNGKWILLQSQYCKLRIANCKLHLANFIQKACQRNIMDTVQIANCELQNARLNMSLPRNKFQPKSLIHRNWFKMLQNVCSSIVAKVISNTFKKKFPKSIYNSNKVNFDGRWY